MENSMVVFVFSDLDQKHTFGQIWAKKSELLARDFFFFFFWDRKYYFWANFVQKFEIVCKVKFDA